MKVVSADGLTKLIQLIKDNFVDNSTTVAGTVSTLATVATSGDYDDLSNKPTIPTVGNGTITITQGGISKGTFTTNQGGNTAIDLDAGGAGGAGLNIGDMFYTMRTDSALNGAVECNGATYNTTDFTGAQSIGTLLEAGKVPFVSLTQYATLLSTNGSVGVFGWDGVGNTTFRVPSLNDIFIESGTAAQIGDYLAPGLPNITGTWRAGGGYNQLGPTSLTGAYYKVATGNNTNPEYAVGETAGTVGFDASRSSSVYKNGVTTVQPNTVRYRPMVQLAVSATDEAVETCTGVLADVADLKDLSNITASAKEIIAHNAMPSDRYTQLTLGASFSTYTAPADGYFMLYAQYNSGSNTAFDMYSTDGTALGSRHWFGSGDVQAAGRITVPARKNQTFMVTINGTLKNVDFKFVYANGAQ